jgi:formylmethanofuran dehydrogenase subunit E
MAAGIHARSSAQVMANHAPLVGPRVFAVRGPSHSGKTALCERLVRTLGAEGLRVGWVKRTHHAVDTAGKASDRIWSAGPAVSALRADDRLVLTQDAGSAEPVDMLSKLPGDLDVVLLETHEPADYPTILSSRLSGEPGEGVIGRWELYSEDAALVELMPPIRASLPQDRELDLALRRAIQFHGGHGCAGLILGARLALAGARTLGVAVPDTRKRLIVISETDRCAVDGIQAVTGCRPGKRTLRVLDYGKLAATFLDEHTGAAVRVAARGDLRQRVGANGEDRHQVQRQVYATWPVEDLFTFAEVQFELSQFDRPGPPRSRVICVSCGEEVSDSRHVETEMGPRCRPCVNQPEFASKGASS